MTRDESQQKFVDLWTKNNYIGGLSAITSYGKTRTAIKCSLQSKAKSTTIIVNTIILKKQWESSLKKWKVKNYKVYVVNTAAKLEIETDLLIMDEAHSTACAEWFSKSWKNAKFKKFIWISATIERKDEYHKSLIKTAPCLMKVDFSEALSNGWVSNYTIYNIPLSFTRLERVKYTGIEDSLNNIFKAVAEIKKIDEKYVKRNMFNLAKKFIADKENKDLMILGIRYNKLINKRKSLIYNAQAKKDKTLWFISESKLNDKETIIFSQTTDFAQWVFDNYKEYTTVIHSKMTKKQRELALKHHLDGRTKKRVLSSVKAFNEGFDLPKLTVGINAGYTSSKKDMIQKIGRICRLYGDSEAVFVNLYIKDTQEIYWLRNALYDFDKSKIKWLNS